MCVYWDFGGTKSSKLATSQPVSLSFKSEFTIVISDCYDAFLCTSGHDMIRLKILHYYPNTGRNHKVWSYLSVFLIEDYCQHQLDSLKYASERSRVPRIFLIFIPIHSYFIYFFFFFSMLLVISHSVVVIPRWLTFRSYSSFQITQVPYSNPSSTRIPLTSNLKSLTVKK